jgi:hypothetical protein
MANFKDHRSRESQEGVSAIHRPENCMVIAWVPCDLKMIGLERSSVRCWKHSHLLMEEWSSTRGKVCLLLLFLLRLLCRQNTLTREQKYCVKVSSSWNTKKKMGVGMSWNANRQYLVHLWEFC